MLQQGQVFKLATGGHGASPLWAYRYRTGGRGSKRMQRGGFRSEQDAADALERALETLRRRKGVPRSITLAELVETERGSLWCLAPLAPRHHMCARSPHGCR
jgi:hypothetical protein